MPSIARSADIERQMLAPLEALLRDAQAVLGVELDAERLEDAAGATSSESVALPSSTGTRVEWAPRGLAQPPATSLSSPLRQGAVDSAQPGPLALHTDALPKAASDPAKPGYSSPGATAAVPVVPEVPAEPAKTRFEQSFQSALPTPPSVPPRVERVPRGAQATQPASAISLATSHTTLDGADEMAPSTNSRPTFGDAQSTIGTAPPPSGSAEHAAKVPATLRSAGTDSTQRHVTAPAPPGEALAESFAPSGQHDAAVVAAAACSIRPGEPAEASATRRLSDDGRQAQEAETAPPATSWPDLARRVGAKADAQQLPAIPLRPRQDRPNEQSLSTPAVAHAAVPRGNVQAAARRLANAVEPSLEQAYRLTQARLDTSAASTSERIDSPRLVHNTFNVNVTLRTDDASASPDPTALADALTEVLRTAARRHGLEL